MERFYKRVSPTDVSPTPPSKRPANSSSTRSNVPDTEIPNPQSLSSAPIEMGEFDYSKLPEDTGLPPNILSYPPNVRDQVRRYYLIKGPCQPKNHNFPLTKKGNDHARKFNPCWFMDHASWLEYSIAKDRLFCLQCYLFKSDGADNFVNEGYYGWKKKDRLQKHVGHSESFQNVAKGKCNDLLNQEQHIEATFSKQSDESRRQYQICLGASIQTVRFLLRQGLAFRGDDESEDSTNKGNFLELLQWLGKNNKKEIEPYILENAPKLVSICKQRLQEMRDSGWDSLHAEVALFSQKHGINIITMDGDVSCSASGRPLRNVQEKTIMHKYRVDIFCAIIDMQLKELDDRFTEATTDLLLCVACLNPSDSFYAFDKDSLVCLAQFYPRDFSEFDLVLLDNQLQNYIIDMRSSVEFSGLNGITDLARIMFKTKKDKVYLLVYKRLTLAFILPVATASLERLFSAMKILKNRLRNRMGDEWMNDCLLAYAERDILDNITDDMIMRRFQNMKTRRGRLPLNMETS